MHRKSGRSHNEKTNEQKKKLKTNVYANTKEKKITSNRKKKIHGSRIFFFYLDNLIERIILRLRIPREEFFKEFTSSHLFQCLFLYV